MQDVAVFTLGIERSMPRVWMEGAMPTRAGFELRTRFQIEKCESGPVPRAERTGFRIVSSRSRAGSDRETPILDINSAELLAMFAGLEQVRLICRAEAIHILLLASEPRARERTERVRSKLASGELLASGSLAYGDEVKDGAIEAGFAHEGVAASLASANDVRADLTEHALGIGRTFASATISLNSPMQELAFDEWMSAVSGGAMS